MPIATETSSAASQGCPALAPAMAPKLPVALPFDTIAAAIPQKASSEPTERSMPAVRITKVMPMASNPEIETCRKNVEEVDRREKARLQRGEDRHEDREEDQGREAGQKAEDIEASVSRRIDPGRRGRHDGSLLRVRAP